MNKKKFIILTAVIAMVLIASLFAVAGCEIKDKTLSDQMGIGGMNFGERMLTGLQVAALGVLVVFVVLILLILLIDLTRTLIQVAEKAGEKARKAIASKKSDKEVAVKKEESVPVSVVNAADDEEEIAAVMAAIYAYYESTAPQSANNLKFRVRSIREIK